MPTDPNVYTHEPSFQEVGVNESLILTCEFDGIPTPSVVWLHNDTILKDDERVSILTNNEIGITFLHVTKLQLNDGGIYTCNFNLSKDVFSLAVSTVIVIFCECCEILASYISPICL